MANPAKKTTPVSNVPTRASRIKTTFRTDKVRLEKLSATVTVYGESQLIEVPCFIVSSTDEGLVVRQKARAGSSKQVVKTYPRSRVITQTVELGNGIVHVIDRAPVLVLKDQSVAYEGTDLLATDNKSGEVTRINTVNPSVVVDVVVEDENAASKAVAKKTAGTKPQLQAVTGGKAKTSSRSKRASDFDDE